MQRGGLPLHRLFTNESMRQVATRLHYQDVDALYTAIGAGTVSAAHVAHLLMDMFGGDDDAVDALTARTPVSALVRPQTTGDGPAILVEGSPDVMAKLAKCCQPVPGDAIFGFVTRGGGVSVHRTDCTNATKLNDESERLVEVSWSAPGGTKSASRATIQLEALDRNGLLTETTGVLSEAKLPILAMSSQAGEDRVATIRLTIEVSDIKQLGSIMNQIRNIEGVFDVYRVTA